MSRRSARKRLKWRQARESLYKRESIGGELGTRKVLVERDKRQELSLVGEEADYDRLRFW
jgi:hypothetical protein